MRAIFRRELQGYFYTPAAYIFMGVFLAFSSIFFAVINLADQSSEILRLLFYLSYLWMLLSPVLTMRLLAEDRRQKTDQLLLTSPISLTGMILGKYLAACTVLLITAALTAVYPLIIAVYDTLYAAETLVGYFGFIMQGLAFVALDLFVSSFAKSPVTAVIFALAANLALWLADLIGSALSQLGSTVLPDILDFISLYMRLEPFCNGILSIANTVYFVTFTILMLFLTVRVSDSRRWS